MKKLFLSMVAIASLIFAPFAIADIAAKDSGYYSTQHPIATSIGSKSGSKSASKSALFPPTDITITNSSSAIIYAYIPAGNFTDILYSGTNDHIRNNQGAFNTYIVLQDPNHAQFFANTVCPRALVTVYGYPGSYKVNVDNEYCN